MPLNIERVLGTLLSDGDLIIITGRQGPSAISPEKFPFVAMFKREDGTIRGYIPGSSIALAVNLSDGNKERGYQWRLPRLEDANLIRKQLSFLADGIPLIPEGSELDRPVNAIEVKELQERISKLEAALKDAITVIAITPLSSTSELAQNTIARAHKLFSNT